MEPVPAPPGLRTMLGEGVLVMRPSADLAYTCAFCREPLGNADLVWPWAALPPAAAAELARRKLGGTDVMRGAGEGRRELLHVQCAFDANGREPLSPPVCKHWARSGTCSWRGCCFFLHPCHVAEAVPAGRGVVGGPGMRRKKPRNGHRAARFRFFLIEKFGEETLRAGCGVLDVAGGKGEVGFQLLNLNAVPCTVVDPRPMDLGAFKRMLSLGMYHRNKAFQKYNSSPPGQGGGGGDWGSAGADPHHVPMCLTNAIIGAMGSRGECEVRIREQVARDRLVDWTHARNGDGDTTHEEEEENPGPRRARPTAAAGAGLPEPAGRKQGGGARGRGLQLPQRGGGGGGDGGVECDPSEVYELLAGCSAIVGLHPDQATEPIVDAALALGKPFAVVPCCVHAAAFPGRRFQGEEVTRYDEFLEYLCAKSPRILREDLDFEGRCTVLWAAAGEPAVRVDTRRVSGREGPGDRRRSGGEEQLAGD